MINRLTTKFYFMEYHGASKVNLHKANKQIKNMENTNVNVFTGALSVCTTIPGVSKAGSTDHMRPASSYFAPPNKIFRNTKL